VYRGVQPEQRRWGIRPAVSQHDRSGGGETQTTRDRHPAYAASGGGHDGAALSRFGTNAQRAPLRTYTPATRLHDVVQEELSRGGPDG
jgi:hypothetical protein